MQLLRRTAFLLASVLAVSLLGCLTEPLAKAKPYRMFGDTSHARFGKQLARSAGASMNLTPSGDWIEGCTYESNMCASTYLYDTFQVEVGSAFGGGTVGFLKTQGWGWMKSDLGGPQDSWSEGCGSFLHMLPSCSVKHQFDADCGVYTTKFNAGGVHTFWIPSLELPDVTTTYVKYRCTPTTTPETCQGTYDDDDEDGDGEIDPPPPENRKTPKKHATISGSRASATCTTGGDAEPDPMVCHAEWMTLEISWDNGFSWTVVWAGYVDVCDAAEPFEV